MFNLSNVVNFSWFDVFGLYLSSEKNRFVLITSPHKTLNYEFSRRSRAAKVKKCKKKERKKESRKRMCESRAKLLFWSSNPILVCYCSRCRCHRYRHCLSSLLSFQSGLVYITSMCFEPLIVSRSGEEERDPEYRLLDWHHVDMVCLALFSF